MTTRVYCMKATSRMSAPKLADISVMALAAPGEEPQTAVVPGRIAGLASIAQPSSALAAVTETTPTAKTGQWARISSQHRQGQDARDHQPDQRLRHAEGEGRHREAGAGEREGDARDHRPEQQRRRQAGELEQQDEDDRNGREACPARRDDHRRLRTPPSAACGRAVRRG